MNEATLWGIVILAYVAPFATFEIVRQARRGDGYAPDRWTGWGWGGFVVLLVLWGVKFPAAIVILLALIAAAVAGVRYGLQMLKRSRTP